MIQELRVWFKTFKRDFPWRRERTPYKVLISEMMLQQTRAICVVPYFNTWIEKFPDFQSLSKGSEEEVIKLWEGLGYYSRARNLLLIAKGVVENFNGVLPADIKSILSFKGIGPYTAAAISHFAFNKRELGMDGNIKKVLARFYGYSKSIEIDRPIYDLLDSFLPKEDSAEIFEALIELGATICEKKPKCEKCPLSSECKAYLEDLTSVIPLRKKKEEIITLQRVVFILENKGHVLIKKEEEGVMKGLYEFIYREKKIESFEELKDSIEKEFNFVIESYTALPKVTHHFTKYKCILFPYKCKLRSFEIISNEYKLVKLSQLIEYPFSSGHRKIIKLLS